MSSKKKNKCVKQATDLQSQLVQPSNNISYQHRLGPNTFVPILLQQQIQPQPPSTNYYQVQHPPIYNNWPAGPNNYSNMLAKQPQQHPQPQPQPQPQLPSHKGCSFCRREPRFSCARCGAHYCSQECQKNDWPNHRLWCFVMPPLIPFHARNTPPISPLPKNDSIVLLTGFRRPNLCYVRSMEPADKEQFAKGMVAINNYGTYAPFMTEVPACNTYAVAFCERQYNRVQILSASSEEAIRVLFIDKGYVRTLQLKDLRRAADVVIRILQQAVAVKLKGVPNYMITDEIEEFLERFTDKEYRLEFDENNVDKEFVLKELNSENNLNELISSFANEQKNLNVYAEISVKRNGENDDRKLGAIPKKRETKKENTVEYPRRSDESKDTMIPILKPPFELVPFDENQKNFCVEVTDGSRIEFGLFGCVPQYNSKYLDESYAYLSKYTDTNEAYEPELNEYCLARLNNKWCRIKVINIYQNIYTVINIDTTFEDKIKSNQIRRYPEDFKVPCVTILCKIEGLQPISGNKLFLNFINQRFTINSRHRINKVKETENGITQVQMDDLIDEFILDFQVNIGEIERKKEIEID